METKNNNSKEEIQVTEKESNYIQQALTALNNVSNDFFKNLDFKNVPSLKFDQVALKPGMIIVLEGSFPPALDGDFSSENKTIGHAVIVAENTKKIIEAVDYGGASGHGDVRETDYSKFFDKAGTYYWLWPSDDKATDAKGISAAGYAKKQIGKPYNHKYFNKKNETEFYCSSLCWWSWYKQKIGIGTPYLIPWVSPNDLISFGTKTINKWTK